MVQYLCTYIFCFFSTLFATLYFILYTPNADIPASIPLVQNPDWYMNFRRVNAMQLIDRDIFFHHLGKSIEYAKGADIIILGHSMMLFGIDWQLLTAFANKHNIKIYNMASAGDASGEFLLRVIERYNIHPAIWIINADNHAHSFFEKYLENDVKGDASDVISYHKFQAYKNTLSKHIQWQVELLARKLISSAMINNFYPNYTVFNYRSISNGNWFNETWPNYNEQNEVFTNIREPDCHADPNELHWADDYVKRLKSGQVIITQVPYTRSCRTRIQEIANHLHVPVIAVSCDKMTSFDGGSHLDKVGAIHFTTQLITQLEASAAFRQLLKSKTRA